jgi:hypothetical protein
MPRIVGKILDSSGQPITCKLSVKLNDLLVDTAPQIDTVRVVQEKTFDLLNGDIDIELAESATQRATYNFHVFTPLNTISYFELDGTPYVGPTHEEGGVIYSGASPTSGRQELFAEVLEGERTISRFDAIVPLGQTIQFASLVGQRIISGRFVDRGYFRELIAGLPGTSGATNDNLYPTRGELNALENQITALEVRVEELELNGGGGTGGGVDTVRPVVVTAGYAPISSAVSNYSFTITYTDNVQVNGFTVGANKISVTAPDGFSKTPTLVSKNPSTGNAKIITANYTVPGPFPNQIYTIAASAGAVQDLSGNESLATVVGTFTANVQTSEPAQNGLNQNFTLGGATLTGWTTTSTATATVTANGARVEATAEGWGNALLSPAFKVRNGDRVVIEFTGTDSFGVIGLAPVGKNLAAFSAADSILLFSNNGGGLHNGQNEIGPNKGYTFAPHGNELRLLFLDGALTAEVYSEDPGVFGIMIFRSSTRIAIPRALYNEMQVMVAPFSTGSVVELRRVTTTATLTLPAGVLIERPLAAKRIGYNFDPVITLQNDNWNNPAITSAFGAAAALAGGGLLRVGGDGMNFYDWLRGGMQANVAQRLPAGEGPGHTHGYNQQLPIWLAYQDFRVTGTLPNIKTFFDAAGNQSVIWTINVNTSPTPGSGLTGPQYEIARLQEAIALGMPVTMIELGNELYFNLTYYGKNSTTIGFQSSAQYATQMRDVWIPALKAAFPGIKIAAPAFESNGRGGTRESDWTYDLIELNTVTGGSGSGAQAIAVHPYVNSADLGIASTDFGNVSRASAIARAAYEKLQDKMRSPSLGILPVGGEIWITEAGVIELRESPPGIIICQTWMHGLIVLMIHMVLLKDRRVTVSCIHVLSGNAQWDAVTNEVGQGLSPTGRGTQNVFADGRHPAFVPTISGFVLGQAERQVLGFGGTAQLLADDPDGPYLAWRVFDSGRDRILIVNLSNSSRTFSPPAGNAWNSQRWTNGPWLEVVAVSEIPAAATGTIADGGSINIPAYSLVILIAADEAPPDTTPPTVTLTSFVDEPS